MEEFFLHYRFPPWTAEQEYPQDAPDKRISIHSYKYS